MSCKGFWLACNTAECHSGALIAWVSSFQPSITQKSEPVTIWVSLFYYSRINFRKLSILNINYFFSPMITITFKKKGYTFVTPWLAHVHRHRNNILKPASHIHKNLKINLFSKSQYFLRLSKNKTEIIYGKNQSISTVTSFLKLEKSQHFVSIYLIFGMITARTPECETTDL